MNRIYIVEGIDGSGKTTLCEKLRVWIESKKHTCSVHREPGGTETGEFVREILHQVPMDIKHQLVMFFISRYFLCEKIRYNTDPNHIFIIDRFVPSTYAYHQYGLDVDENKITELHNIICPYAFNIMNESTIIYLKTNPDKAIERIQKRNEQLSGYETIQFLEKISNGYDEIFKKTINNNGENLIVVNTSNRSEDEVWKEVQERLDSRFLD